MAAPDYGVTKLPHHVLVDIAEKADCVLELVPAMGDFVPRGGPLFRVRGPPGAASHRAAALSVILERERTHQFEPAFGLRKLVDVAARSHLLEPLPGPDHLRAVDQRHPRHPPPLARREFPSGRHHDAHGHVRLVRTVMSWEGYVRLAFDELRLAGAGSPRSRAGSAALEDLRNGGAARAPGTARPSARAACDDAVRNAYADPPDVAAALAPTPPGLGSGPDVSSLDHDLPSEESSGPSPAIRPRAPSDLGRHFALAEQRPQGYLAVAGRP